ncbi:hypothetical protein SDC9_15851 [bioreactor metagenome]|uniref:Uncharacterized protein n=1 Tax=bioreactor metagenome TaxID=1076179 RepID=A0A644TT82_9ZZZZ
MKKSFIPIMKLLIVLVALFIIPLFFSCEDNDEDIITYYDTYIDGYIKDYHTGEPVAGVIFDVDYYTEHTTGGWFSPDPYFAKNVTTSNAQGYYKIRVPKEWNGNEIVMIRVNRRDHTDYSFSDMQGPLYKNYRYAEKGLKTRSKREVDIRPITYGYLKVTLPKTSSQNWGFGTYMDNSYEKPYYYPELVITESYNDSLNYFFFKVPASGGMLRIGNNAWSNPARFTIENPRDTVIINVEE